MSDTSDCQGHPGHLLGHFLLHAGVSCKVSGVAIMLYHLMLNCLLTPYGYDILGSHKLSGRCTFCSFSQIAVPRCQMCCLVATRVGLCVNSCLDYPDIVTNLDMIDVHNFLLCDSVVVNCQICLMMPNRLSDTPCWCLGSCVVVKSFVGCCLYRVVPIFKLTHSAGTISERSVWCRIDLS